MLLRHGEEVERVEPGDVAVNHRTIVLMEH